MANRDPEPESRHVQVSAEYTALTGKTADDLLKELEANIPLVEEVLNETEEKLEVVTFDDIIADEEGSSVKIDLDDYQAP